MKNSIVKLGIAAALISVVGLGIVEFISTGGTSGVVWAEVAQKVDASRGVVFRARDTNSDDPDDYMVMRRSPMYSRTEWYRGGQVSRVLCTDRDAKTVLWVNHDAKVYYRRPLTEQELNAPQEGWTDPQQLVNRLLSGTYRKLGRKTVEGVLCEGIETTDSTIVGAEFPIQSFVARMWVSVETGYPVFVESEIVGGDEDQVHQKSTADQFQWDVEVGPQECDVTIPADYRSME